MLRLKWWSPALVLAVALGSCRTVPTTPSYDATTVISPLEQWCGGRVRLQAERYRVIEPTFEVSGQRVDQRRIDRETFEIGLPQRTCGMLTIDESSTLGEFRVGTVHAAGFAEQFTVGPALVGGLKPWPTGGVASVLGATEQGVAVFHPATHSMLEFPGIHSYGPLRAVGLSYDPSKVFLYSAVTGGIEAWRLFPAPTRDSMAPPAPATSGWDVLEMGPATWLVAYHHEVFTYQGSQNQVYEIVEETQGTLLSPDGRLGTIRVHAAPNGIPVFDASSGAVAYRVEEVRASYGADFSPDGSRLYFAGRDQTTSTYTSPGIVAGVDTRDGSLLYLHQLGDYVANAALADPSAPLLYVAAAALDSLGEPSPLPTIFVYDADTGDRLATLETSQAANLELCSVYCFGGILVHDPFVDELYYVTTRLQDILVFRYTLPRNRDELFASPSGGRISLAP